MPSLKTCPSGSPTDPHLSYKDHINAFFGERGSFSYATEKKIFKDAFNPEQFPTHRKNGIPKIVEAEREAVFEAPDLRTATTCHLERFFLTVRQELKRYQRLGLGYSKKLGMHKFATAIQIGIYNLCRRHLSLKGQTPAQAAGLADHRWSIEEVIALTDAYLKPREEKKAAARAAARRMAEDAVFLQAMKDLSQAGVRL